MDQSCIEVEVDLDEWEFIPADNRALPEDRNHGSRKKDAVFNEITVDLNYFICPLVKEKAISGSRKQLIPQPALLDSDSTEAMDAEEAEDLHESNDVGVVVAPPEVLVIHHDVLYSQVLFKKLIDVEVDSPASSSRAAALMAPQLEPEKVQLIEGEEQGSMLLEEAASEKEKEYDSTGSQAKDGFRLVVCNRKLTGIGAFFSMGAAAAATICILIVGGRQHQKQQQEQQKIHLNTYTNDKVLQTLDDQSRKYNRSNQYSLQN